MDNLFNPWRMAYLKSKPPKGCIFCVAWKEKISKKTLCFYKGEKTLVMLNRFPYTNGHLMVVPSEHRDDIEKLSSENLKEIMDLIIFSKRVLGDVFKPHGYNIGLNIGSCAGAGLKDHIHFHIVPRWEGDTNFMTTISNTRMVPQSLEETFEILKKAFGEKND